jgi:hypothetical protein
MIHELRIYHCMPGRLPDLSRRFETITTKLWERHGIRPVAFWTVAIGPASNDFYYILEWESLADRELKWARFAADPEWIEKRAETERNGPLLADISNLFLSPTSYSPLR